MIFQYLYFLLFPPSDISTIYVLNFLLLVIILSVIVKCFYCESFHYHFFKLTDSSLDYVFSVDEIIKGILYFCYCDFISHISFWFILRVPLFLITPLPRFYVLCNFSNRALTILIMVVLKFGFITPTVVSFLSLVWCVLFIFHRSHPIWQYMALQSVL